MSKNGNNSVNISKRDGPVGFVLFVAFIGAAVYFVNQVDGFWNIIFAVLKGMVWPAILIYNVFQSFTA